MRMLRQIFAAVPARRSGFPIRKRPQIGAEAPDYRQRSCLGSAAPEQGHGCNKRQKNSISQDTHQNNPKCQYDCLLITGWPIQRLTLRFVELLAKQKMEIP